MSTLNSSVRYGSTEFGSGLPPSSLVKHGFVSIVQQQFRSYRSGDHVDATSVFSVGTRDARGLGVHSDITASGQVSGFIFFEVTVPVPEYFHPKRGIVFFFFFFSVPAPQICEGKWTDRRHDQRRLMAFDGFSWTASKHERMSERRRIAQIRRTCSRFGRPPQHCDNFQLHIRVVLYNRVSLKHKYLLCLKRKSEKKKDNIAPHRCCVLSATKTSENNARRLYTRVNEWSCFFFPTQHCYNRINHY